MKLTLCGRDIINNFLNINPKAYKFKNEDQVDLLMIECTNIMSKNRKYQSSSLSSDFTWETVIIKFIDIDNDAFYLESKPILNKVDLQKLSDKIFEEIINDDVKISNDFIKVIV